MKLPSIFAASLLVAGAAFADSTTIETTYEVGVMPLTVTEQETVICVPWVEAGTASDAGIAASNLVKTATLSVNDELYWYDTASGKFASWRIASNGGTNYWNAVTDAGSGASLSSDAANIKRGDAVILKLSSAPSESKTVYIVGQVAATSAGATTVAGATAGENGNTATYTLLAPPIAGSSGTVDLNTVATWTTPGTSDSLIVGFETVSTGSGSFTRQKTLSWGSDGTSSGWGTYSGMTFTKEATIPVGTGFWYKRAATNDVTVTWSNQNN